MLEILQQPDPYNYSKSTRDLVLLTDHNKVDVSVYYGTYSDRGADIVTETYTPFSATQPLTIKFRDLFHSLLSSNLPAGTDGSTIHPDMIRQIGITIDATGNGLQNMAFRDFRFVKGILGRQQPDLSLFWRNQWLAGTFYPQTVGLYDPVFLSCVALATTTIRVEVTFEDDTTQTTTLTTAQPNQLISVNVSPSFIQSMSGTKPVKQYEVLGLVGSAPTLRRQRYVIDRKTDELIRDKFLYLNSRGGWDTLILTGQTEEERNATIESAMFDDIQRQYHIAPTLTTTKSGYVQSTEHVNQIIEFIYSEQRHHVQHGIPQPINLTDPQVTLTKLQLNQVEIQFTYADSKFNYPQLEHVPTYLAQ